MKSARSCQIVFVCLPSPNEYSIFNNDAAQANLTFVCSFSWCLSYSSRTQALWEQGPGVPCASAYTQGLEACLRRNRSPVNARRGTGGLSCGREPLELLDCEVTMKLFWTNYSRGLGFRGLGWIVWDRLGARRTKKIPKIT